MTTLNDVLESAISIGIYQHANKSHPDVFYHFTKFGSIRCTAEQFNTQGVKLGDESVLLLIDGEDMRKGYEFVPEDQAPQALKRFYEQTSSKCTKRDIIPALHPNLQEDERLPSGSLFEPF